MNEKSADKATCHLPLATCILLLVITTFLSGCQPVVPGLSGAAAAQTIGHAKAAVDPGTSDAPIFIEEPPDAGKINVGPPDVDGQTVMTGSAGAVPADVSLAVINISTRNVITATAASNGSFQTSLFAPPGSSLLVKYSLDPQVIEALWHDSFQQPGDFAYMNILPGTTITVPGPPVGSGVPFHAAGYFGPGEGPDWAGWWLSGETTGFSTSGGLHAQAGASLTINGMLFMTSPALNCTDPPPFTPNLVFHVNTLFGPEGQARLGKTWFNSFLFTPTGLPIEHEADGEARPIGGATVTNLTCLSQNTLQGSFATTVDLPLDLSDGFYQIEVLTFDGGLPLASGIPRVVVWYHYDPFAALQSFTAGSPDPPQIPWTLLSHYPTNGHRGLQALEDAGRYQLVPRTIMPPHRVALPMRDARSGEPITYRLEPGSNWLSATDRRFPNPPFITLALPGGNLQVEVHKPDGSHDILGPAPVAQSSVTTPSLPDGTLMHEGTGHPGDIYHLQPDGDPFDYAFDQYGPHTIVLSGFVEDIYGNQFPIDRHYEVMIARVLDLDPAQLPTTPYKQGDAFAPGLHIFPPVPANVEIHLVHMPNSDPNQAQETVISGRANRFGYFQPPAGTEVRFDSPGEFRVDVTAEYPAPDGKLWAGYITWGNVVENDDPLIEAHGRRGMDYSGLTIDDMPPWFFNENLPPDKIGIENYYPYFSGDIHWGDEQADPAYRGDSIHSIITLRDLTGPSETIYDLMRQYHPRATNMFRQPPTQFDAAGLEKRLDVGEGPLFMTTVNGKEPTIYPDEIDMWGYFYTSSERPDVHVREILSEDGMGTAYWRFNDTYAYQIGEPADGDQPGDMKWEFGGVVFRVPGQDIAQYAIYSSLWVLLPHGCDAYGCARVTPPFQDATGAGINGGPIMELLGQDIDMLFLPKGVRPGDVLEVGDTISFSGHVGPPLDSRVEVTITSPTGVPTSRTWHANKIGWLYDPAFDFVATEPGRWTVDVFVEHDRPYVGNGVTPTSHNTGTVLGTNGRYSFYVVEPGSPRLFILDPPSGYITVPPSGLEPIVIQGIAPAGTSAVHYTIHDKGIVMGQGNLMLDDQGRFSLAYDPVALHQDFSMLSLVAHDGRHEGLADEVTINFLAIGAPARANTVTLIGEEIFAGNAAHRILLPATLKGP